MACASDMLATFTETLRASGGLFIVKTTADDRYGLRSYGRGGEETEMVTRDGTE